VDSQGRQPVPRITHARDALAELELGLGAGFEAPYQMAEQKQAVQKGQLQNEMLKRQTEVLGQQVMLPNGTVLPWQFAQKLGPAIIGASSREKGCRAEQPDQIKHRGRC
jgi:hypothetical protein